MSFLASLVLLINQNFQIYYKNFKTHSKLSNTYRPDKTRSFEIDFEFGVFCQTSVCSIRLLSIKHAFDAIGLFARLANEATRYQMSVGQSLSHNHSKSVGRIIPAGSSSATDAIIRYDER